MSKNHACNMSDAERWGSMASGVAMALYGLSRRRASGLMLAVGGILLFRRGFVGHCATYEFLGLSTSKESDVLPPHGDPLARQIR
jgi:uncharacterized membrane protein